MDIKSALKSFVGNASPLGVAASLGSSIAGAISQNRIVDKQLKAQAAENQKNRDYNLMLARTQNQWNLEQWQRENDYNSPTSQMARLRSAGLNPDLMYGQGTTGNSNSSPMLTSGAPSSPQDMSPMLMKRSFGNVVQDTLNQEMQRAQIEAIRANTRKTEEETEGIGIDNYIKNGTKEDTIKLAGLQVTGAKILNDLNETQRSSLLKGIEQMSQNMEESKARVSQIEAQVAQLSFDQQMDLARLFLDAAVSEATISNLGASTRKMIAEANMTEREYIEAVATFELRKMGLQLDNMDKVAGIDLKRAQTSEVYKQMEVMDTQIAQNKFNLEYDKKYKAKHAKWQLAFQGLSAVGSLAVGISSAAGSLTSIFSTLGKKAIASFGSPSSQNWLP